jgi:hypothetical protein
LCDRVSRPAHRAGQDGGRGARIEARDSVGLIRLLSISQCSIPAECSIHRTVSSGADDWEYADSSVRDMATFGFVVIASGLIVIVSEKRPARALNRREPRPSR